MAGRIKWVVPVAGDVTALMSSIVQSGVTVDAGGANRGATCLNMAVEQVLGAIRTGNRVPMSLTPGAVPPGGHMHTVVLGVSLMISSTPNMGFAVKEEFSKQVEDAKDWVKDVREGTCAVDYPIDPDQTTLPGGGKLWGSNTPVDMTTDGETAEYYIPPVAPATNAPSFAEAIPGKGVILLNWGIPANPTGTVVTYSVYRGIGPGLESVTPIIQGLVQTSWVDSGLTSGTAYFYYVVATNSQGASKPSSEVSATAI